MNVPVYGVKCDNFQENRLKGILLLMANLAGGDADVGRRINENSHLSASDTLQLIYDYVFY
ncbi:hypothetical protein PROVRUST_06691 [Providencia rustigianii DSM 4541]|uniref:Uncharacterized protein n=1 Tax=Providencia rustigianii DSM 4541 TaxID=500637 RepID=D1P3T5_9GAMM|nr:hypothetical protein PROVRUST_06691 [Providencia rustigianii DSM 4541]